MTAQELNTYIDKVLGNSIRCLLPSYWWRRLLKLIIEYTEVVDKKLDRNVNSLNEKIDNLNYVLKKICKSTFVVTTGTDGGVNVIVDGKSVSIDSGLTKNIDFSNSFRIQNGGMYIDSLQIIRSNTALNESMNSMFFNCMALTSLDVSNFDTSNVTDMNEMFSGCSSLVTLTLGADFFKVKSLDTPLDFSSLANWSSESAIPSLVTNSYDRTAN